MANKLQEILGVKDLDENNDKFPVYYRPYSA